MRLTRETVSNIISPAAGKSEQIIFDEDLPGFGLRVRASGKRTWIAQYRVGPKQRRITLGTPATLSPSEARKTAKDVLAQSQLGNDPQAERRQEHQRAELTLAAAADLYMEQASERLKPRTYVEAKHHLKTQWKPLRSMALHKITRVDVAARLTTLTKVSGPIAANRARTSLSAFFSWALREGIADANPVIGTNKAKERPRDRVLTHDELAAIWGACRNDDYGRIVRLLILLGQRPGEVAGMARSEINLEDAQWSIPSERTKNGCPHDIPLSDNALEIIRGIPERGRSFLFGDAEGPFQGWSRAKAALNKRISESREGQPIESWQLRDIRRTVATDMNEMGILPHVVEALLNHISGHKAGVAGIYNRAQYVQEKRQAINLWAARLGEITDSQRSKVVLLHGSS